MRVTEISSGRIVRSKEKEKIPLSRARFKNSFREGHRSTGYRKAPERSIVYIIESAFRLILEFYFRKPVGFWGTPSPGSIGAIELGENLRQNLGAQQLRGKILSRKELARIDRLLYTDCCFQRFRLGYDLLLFGLSARTEVTWVCDYSRKDAARKTSETSRLSPGSRPQVLPRFSAESSSFQKQPSGRTPLDGLSKSAGAVHVYFIEAVFHLILGFILGNRQVFGGPPPLAVYWSHRVRGKSQAKSWGSAA